jgi:hypothetical protein
MQTSCRLEQRCRDLCHYSWSSIPLVFSNTPLPAKLEGIAETGRRLHTPALESLGRRKLVERVVDFHGVEQPSVELKPMPLRNTFRVHNVLPMLVHIP